MMAVVFLDVWSSNKHGIGQTPLMDGVPVPGLKFSWRYSRRETSREISESVSSLTQPRFFFIVSRCICIHLPRPQLLSTKRRILLTSFSRRQSSATPVAGTLQ